MLVKSAVVDCQKSALMILMCVRYVIHDYSAMYLSLLPLLTLLLLLPLSQPQIHVCMHFSVIRPAPARENRSDLNRHGVAIKWCVKWTILLTPVTRVLKPFSSVVDKKSPAPLRIIANNLGVYINEVAFMLGTCIGPFLHHL